LQFNDFILPPKMMPRPAHFVSMIFAKQAYVDRSAGRPAGVGDFGDV
jgi:hypothetical protein